ncbi:hypothetical protein [Ferrimicrobium sp.]|uniref:hypothetical protein n=1 Tax=Ferrimicrobium sp. TaxID=2926050 RepID=UPI0026100018|nr:hypothetical protein [Ferrimicrobium sp.]
MRLRDDANLMLMIACLVVDVILGVAAGVASSRIVSLVLVGTAAMLSVSVMYFVRLRP